MFSADVLLIKELLKYTPKDHPDNPLLAEALKGVEAAAKAINEATREAEQRKEVLDLETKFVGGAKLVQPGRLVAFFRALVESFRACFSLPLRFFSPFCWLFLLFFMRVFALLFGESPRERRSSARRFSTWKPSLWGGARLVQRGRLVVFYRACFSFPCLSFSFHFLPCFFGFLCSCVARQ